MERSQFFSPLLPPRQVEQRKILRMAGIAPSWDSLSSRNKFNRDKITRSFIREKIHIYIYTGILTRRPAEKYFRLNLFRLPR